METMGSPITNGAESVGEEESHLNPLNNHLILENVFRHSNFSDLKTCRVVSKHWQQVSLPFWCDQAPYMKLGEATNDDATNVPPAAWGSSYLNISDYLKHLDDSDEHPDYEWAGRQKLGKIQPQGISLHPENHLLNQFWTYAGNRVSHLQLKDCVLSSVSTFRSILLCQFTPSLKVLKVHMSFAGGIMDMTETEGDGVGVGAVQAPPPPPPNKHLRRLEIEWDYPSESSRAFPVDWMELLSHFPNLQELSVAKMATRADLEKRIIGVISSIREGNREALPLKELDILNLNFFDSRFHLSPDLLGMFEKARLPLEVLKIDIGDTTLSVLHDILKMHAKLLKSVVLRRSRRLPPVALGFPPPAAEVALVPPMEALEELHLLKDAPLDTLQFLKNSPHLKTLEVDGLQFFKTLKSGSTSGTGGESGGVVAASVSCLRCMNPNVYLKFTWNEMQKLFLLFPNVVELTMQLTNDTFRWICQYWPKLKVIRTYNNIVDDEGFTGVLNSSWTKVETTPPDSQNGGGGLYSMSDLKELREFGISQNSRSSIVKVTDKSVFYGFLKAPLLERLELPADHLSGDAILALMRQVRDVKLYNSGME